MNKELWIKRAEEIIANNLQDIQEMDFTVSSEYFDENDYREFILYENKFL